MNNEEKRELCLSLMRAIVRWKLIPNSESNGQYVSSCSAVGAKAHPARFPEKLSEFLIRFLTDPGELVFDIFAGSNIAGAVAESWISFELDLD